MLQTFHALGQDHHCVEQAYMTSWERAQTIGIVMLATLMGIGALYVGRTFFVPVALALLLNALLRPLVRGLERLHVSTVVGATMVSLGLLSVLVVGGGALVNPVRAWVNQLPASFEAAGHKLAPARESLEQVSQATHALGERSGQPPAAPTPPAVPSFLVQFFGTTATLVAGLTEVLLLLYLLLASGDLFLRKLVEVLPVFRDKRTAVEVTEQVQQAVTQYIVATLAINVGQGIVVGFALWGLEMHSPWLWGGLTVILEFIPYLGATGMIILLTAAAFSQFDSIGHILLVPGTYLVIAALQNNLVSPLVYGQRLKLNPVAVLIGVLFWWLLWGVAGAFLAVPFFATLKILADHVESLTPIATFLGE
jgi:predicted PurR-regulated permease PerM